MKVFAEKEIALSVREDKLKRNMEESLNFFNIDCRNLLSVSYSYYPLEVLDRARRESEGQSKDEIACLSSRALPLLLQSLFQSSSFKPEKGFSSERKIRDKDWSRIKDLSYDAVKRLLRYSENFAALKVKQGEVSEENYDIYRDRLVSQLFLDSASFKDRVLSELCTKEIFYGNEKEAEEYFFTDAEFFSKEVGKLLSSLSSADSSLETERMFLTMRINSRMREIKQSKPELSDQELYDQAVKRDDIASELDAYNRRVTTYSSSSVEGLSLLSSKTSEVFSLNVSSSESAPFYREGCFSAVYHPFIRFASRYYTFLGQKLAAALPFAVRRRLHDEGKSFNTSGKIFKIARDCLTSMMSETDIPDVFQWEGKKLDVVALSSLRWINAWKHPVHFNERALRRKEDAAQKAPVGHTLLIVDPDAEEGTIIQNEERKFTISLNDLIAAAGDDEKTKQFFDLLFGPREEDEKAEELEELLEDDLYHEEEDLTLPEELSAEEKEFEDVYEAEYDGGDDDEKAREIETRFDSLDAVPPEIKLKKKSKEEIESIMEKYEFPSDFAPESEEALSLDLDSEEYESEEEEEKLEEESEALEEDPLFDLFDDDDEEEEDEAAENYKEIVPLPDLWEDEYSQEETEEEDDPSQLYLFSLHEASEAEEDDDEIVVSDEQKDFMSKAKEAENEALGEEEFFDLDDDEEEAVIEDELITDEDEEEEKLSSFNEEEEVFNSVPLEEESEEPLQLFDEKEEAEKAVPLEAEGGFLFPDDDEEFSDEEDDVSSPQTIDNPPEKEEEEIAIEEAPFVRDDGERPDVTEEELLDEVEDDVSALDAIDGIPEAEEEESATEEDAFVRDDGERPDVTEEELLDKVEDDVSSPDAIASLSEAEEEESATEEDAFVRDDGERPDVTEEELLDKVEDDVSSLNAIDGIPEAEEEESATEEAPFVADEGKAEEELLEDDGSHSADSAPEKEVSVPLSASEKTEEKPLDRRSLPRFIKRLVAAIGERNAAPFTKYLSSADSATIVDLDKALSSCAEQVIKESKDKMLSIMDSGISIVIASNSQSDELKYRSLRNNIGAVMYGHYASSWISIIAFCSEEGEITKATLDTLSERAFSDYEWKIVRVLGEEIRNRH